MIEPGELKNRGRTQDYNQSDSGSLELLDHDVERQRHQGNLPRDAYGDIEHIAESWLVEHYGEQLKSTVLIAPHHGSKTSSSFEFLQYVQPELVAIPVGFLNRFRFPHQSVLDRYQQLNARWLSSAESGAISIRVDAEQLQVETERGKHKHYWQAAREAM